jgi:hypothetical protein
MSLVTGPGPIADNACGVVMSNVLVHTLTSLDGFIAGPNEHELGL